MALFKDILYPGNPERRDKVVRKYQELLSCMKDNFCATNQLATYMKEQFNVKSAVGRIVHTYNNLELTEGTTIKENCDKFLKETDKLKMAMDQLDRELAGKLNPEAYKTLKDTSIGFKETIRQLAQWGSVIIGIGAAVAAVVVVCRITAGAFLAAIAETITMVATCAIAGVAVVALSLVVDAIVSAILGYIERSKLEAAIDEMDKSLATFEPATRKYTQTIYEILGAIKYLN